MTQLMNSSVNNQIEARAARESDLQDIVALSEFLFGDCGMLFTPISIKKHFDNCPEAFFVVYENGILIGHALIFPLTKEGLDEICAKKIYTLVNIDTKYIAKEFSADVEAFFFEELCLRHDSQFARIKIGRRYKDIVSTYNKPVVAYALTDAGKKITGKAGFTRLNDSDLIIYHPAQLKQ